MLNRIPTTTQRRMAKPFAILSTLLYFSFLPMAHCQSLRDLVVDFDSVLPISNRPLGVSIFASNDPHQHVYFLIPNTIQLSTSPNGKPLVGVQHYGITKHDKAGHGAFLTITLEPAIGGGVSIDDVMQYVKTVDPQATFALPLPLSSKLELMTNSRFIEGKFEPQQVDTASAAGRTAFQANLSILGVRLFLSEGIENSDFMIAKYTFKLRGVHAQTSQQIVERDFVYSLSFPVSCKRNPEQFVDLTRHKVGCVKLPKHWWQH